MGSVLSVVENCIGISRRVKPLVDPDCPICKGSGNIPISNPDAIDQMLLEIFDRDMVIRPCPKCFPRIDRIIREFRNG